MSESVYELIEVINAPHYKTFEVLTPQKKAMTIFRDFEDYYMFQRRAGASTNAEKKERYFFEVERVFVKAQKELRMLSQEELGEYISYVTDRVGKAIDCANQKRYMDNKLLYSTILGQMPREMSDDNRQKLDVLRDNVFMYDERMREDFASER